MVTNTNNLTTFAESAPEGLATVGQRDQLAYMANPYEDPEMEKILSRKYKIADFTWADTDTFNQSIGTVDPMALLVGIKNISDKLTQFRWMRADVKLEFRINATPFHIGSLVISHLPRTTAANSPPAMYFRKTRTLSQKSQNHAMILSASSMNNITMTINREAPILFDYIDESNVFNGALGTVDISVLNPLILANGTAPAPVNVAVFASFVNPKVAGYGYFPLLSSAARAPKIAQHSMTVADEAKSRASNSIIGPEAQSLFNPAMVTGALEQLQSMVETIAPAAQFAMSLGLSKPPNETTVMPAVLDDFRDLNYTHGVNQATKFATHPNASVGQVQIGDLRKHKISEFIQRPMFLKTLIITKNSEVDTPLSTIPMHPSLSSYGSGLYTPTPVAYMSQLFNWWRGGMKVMFEFITSQFVTARFRITHWPAPNLPSSLEEYAGDAVSTIVDVRGDTRVTFTVPYISPYPYQRCRGYLHSNYPNGWARLPASEQNSFITLSLINSLQQPDFSQEAVIYVNIYVSAAEDFVFGALTAPFIREPLSQDETGRAPKITQHALVDRFAEPFKPMVPAHGAYEAGLVLPEQYTGVEEICMKYACYTDAENDATTLVKPTLTEDLANVTNLDYLGFFATCYRWNRGGLRYKLVPSTWSNADSEAVTAYAASVETGYPAPSYLAISDLRARGCVEFEIPWCLSTYMNTYFLLTFPQDLLAVSPPWELVVGNLARTAGYPGMVGYRSAADDWVFGHQIATDTYPFASSNVAAHQSSKGKTKEPQTIAPELDQSLGLTPTVREKLTKYLLSKSAQTASTSSQ